MTDLCNKSLGLAVVLHWEDFDLLGQVYAKKIIVTQKSLYLFSSKDPKFIKCNHIEN